MQDMYLTLNIKDKIICKCSRNTYEKKVNVTSSSDTIDLLGGYILNVIFSDNLKTTVLIQNGQNVIIRNIYNYETEICLPPCDNCLHYISISNE